MLKDIVEVRSLGGYRLFLRFEDGLAGELDISSLVTFDGIFADIRDPARFALVKLNRELGTICWPNGADLDPDVLYSNLVSKAAS